LATSLIYQHSWIYELAMFALYGRHYRARYRAVAELVPAGASVLDLCCGPATLYHRHLRAKGVNYTGLDINPRFIRHLVRGGGHGMVWDVHGPEALPQADYVLMHASLYHFLPDPGPVVERMLRAARQQVIVAEPVRNLATGSSRWLALLARRHTDPGSGTAGGRFTEATLEAFFARYANRVLRSFPIPGGREKVYVLAGGRR
jgi:SAM-dependent methyltransferase